MTKQQQKKCEELAEKYVGSIRQYKRYSCIEDDFKAGYKAGIAEADRLVSCLAMDNNSFISLKDAEKAIIKASVEVELLGADLLLTDAINLLWEAKEKVSDYIDKGLNRSGN